MAGGRSSHGSGHPEQPGRPVSRPPRPSVHGQADHHRAGDDGQHDQERQGVADQPLDADQGIQAGRLDPADLVQLAVADHRHRADQDHGDGDRRGPAQDEAPVDPVLLAGPGQRDRVRDHEEQAEQVGEAEEHQRHAVARQPAAPGGIGLERTGLESTEQAVAGHAGERGHHRPFPGVLGEPADLRQEREGQSGRQPGPGGNEPPAEEGDHGRGDGHGDRRRESHRQLAAAAGPDDDPDQRVIGAVHHVDVAQHADQPGEAPVYRGQRRALIPGEGRPGDLVQAGQQRDQGRHQRQPRPARIGAVPLRDRPGPARSLPVNDGGGRGSRQFAVLTKAAAGSPAPKNGRSCPNSHTLREQEVPLSRSPVALVIPLEKIG